MQVCFFPFKRPTLNTQANRTSNVQERNTMKALNILDFRTDNPALLLVGLLPVAINIGILLYVSLTQPNTKVNALFIVFLFILTGWQLAEACTHLSTSAEMAMFWARQSTTIILFLGPFSILFGLRYAKWHRWMNPAILFIFLFLPSILATLGIVSSQEVCTILHSKNWNWVSNPIPHGLSLIIYTLVSMLSILTLIVFWSIHLAKRKNTALRLPSLLIAIGFTIPIFSGIACEVIAPFLFHVDVVPITAPLVTIFSVLTFIAITRYRLLDFSPINQWDKILHITHEGILIVNKNDEIMYANDCVCEMTGYCLPEIFGKKASTLFTGASSWIVPTEKMKGTANEIHGRAELQIKTKWGGNLWVVMSGSPYLDSGNKTIGSIILFTNINELKKADAGLRAKVEELNDFFYKSSHDLKSPAASILGLISLLNYSEESEKPFIHNAIETSAHKLIETTDRLAQIANVTKRNVEISRINWEEKINSIHTELHPKEADYIFEKEISMNGLYYSDPYLIRTILKIAMENAIHYRDLNKKDSKIHIAIQQEQYGVVIQLDDNGCGMSPDLQKKLFSLFCKGSANSGIGLGLYTLKAALDKLGGKVSIESNKGVGTKVTLFIPDQMMMVA
jgi:PAS domain S-box-containing protein